MKLSLLITFLFLSTAVYSQEAQPPAANIINASATPSPKSSPPADGAKNSEAKENKNIDDKNANDAVKKSRFNLPREKVEPMRVPRFDQSPVIDGKLDEPVWQQAATFKDFYQISPGDNIAASKPTIAYMGYDERHLYLAFYCFDEPDKIRASVASRDNVFGEDNVRVWLDTYNDQRRAYILGFNPLGIQMDGIVTEGQGQDFSVDIVMESKGSIVADGWVVEVKIPFKSLRYTAGKGKMWGFNVARNIDRLNDELDSWMPDDRNISGTLVKHGKITGLENIKTERTLEIVPSVTLSETGRRTRTVPRYILNQVGPYHPVLNQTGVIDPGRFVNQPIEQDIGVTVKFGITPNITLDAAINPDFAEIEADAPVVTANQRFPIFFQEKRPFFLEGVEIFQSPLRVFYSRTIEDPDAAAKLTGKIGKTSFGFLAATDKAPGNFDEDDRNDPSVRPRIDEFIDKNAHFAIVRVKRDIGKENNIGFFGTARVFPERRNFLGGFDGRFKFSPKLVSQFQVVGTSTRSCFGDPEFEPSLHPAQAQRNREICGGNRFSQYRTGNGIGYYWNLDYTEKNRGWVIEAVGRSKDYRADSGFTRRTNTNSIFVGARLSTEPKSKGTLLRADFRPGASINYDWKGRAQDSSLSGNFSLALQGSTYVNFGGGISYERVFEEEFGLKRMPSRPDDGAFIGAPERSTYQPYVSANVSKTFNKKFSAYGFIGTIWNAFDFDFGGGNRYPRVSPLYVAYQAAFDEYLRLFIQRPNDPTLVRPTAPALDPGPGRQFDLNLGFNYKPTDPLRVSLDYTKARLTRNDTGRTAFDTNIFTLRSTYQFTRFAFVRTRVDYDTLQSRAAGQLLFGWNPNPGTALYVGYNDSINYNGFNPFTGQLEPRFERNSRTFFIRASYLFRRSF